MSLNKIVSRIESIVPNLVSTSGTSPDLSPGLVIGIVTEEGSRVLGFGTTDLEGGHVPDGDTFFGIGSVTKVFTGLSLAAAVADGRVRLDDSANTYLPPDLQLPDDAITLRHLVSHTSGLPNYPENIDAFRDMDRDGANDWDELTPGRNYSRRQLSEWLSKDARLDFKPGRDDQYSNLGTGMLSLLLQEKLRYASFEEINREMITRPLGMKSTLPNTANMQRLARNNQAQGYAPLDDGLIPVEHSDMGVLDGAGELVSTGNDLIKFLEGLTGIKKTPLTQAFQEACKPVADLSEAKMGYSMMIKPSTKGGDYYAKPGGTAGYSAIIAWRTNPKVGIVVLSNRGKYKRVNQLAMKLIEAAVN